MPVRGLTRRAPTSNLCQALLGGIVLGMRGANGLGAGFQFSRRRAALHLAKKTSVVPENRGHVGVLGAKGFLPDGERPLVERLGLGVLALSL